jgi:hypothetical protein
VQQQRDVCVPTAAGSGNREGVVSGAIPCDESTLQSGARVRVFAQRNARVCAYVVCMYMKEIAATKTYEHECMCVCVFVCLCVCVYVSCVPRKAAKATKEAPRAKNSNARDSTTATLRAFGPRRAPNLRRKYFVVRNKLHMVNDQN